MHPFARKILETLRDWLVAAVLIALMLAAFGLFVSFMISGVEDEPPAPVPAPMYIQSQPSAEEYYEDDDGPDYQGRAVR